MAWEGRGRDVMSEEKDTPMAHLYKWKLREASLKSQDRKRKGDGLKAVARVKSRPQRIRARRRGGHS